MLKVGPTDDLKTCHALRYTVFVQGQNVLVGEEQDGLDDQALHILAQLDGVPVGCARAVIDDGTAKIGRVCVLDECRGKGIGLALMQAMLDHLRDQPGVTRAVLGAQTHALGFYEALGFSAYGPEFLDARMPHRMMGRDL